MASGGLTSGLLFLGGGGAATVTVLALNGNFSSSGTSTSTTSKQTSAPAKDAKQELEEWVKTTFTDKCTLHLKKGTEFKELKDTSITASDVEGLKDFLDKENKIAALCAGDVQKQVKVEWPTSTKTGIVENETYKVRKLIAEKFTNDRKCTFKFKPKDESDFKSIEELTDDKVTGLHNYLSECFTKNSVCPKLANPTNPPASREEKVENKNGTWQLVSAGTGA